MNREAWLAGLIPGDHVIVESTDPMIRERIQRIQARLPDGFLLTSGIRLNVHGKVDMDGGTVSIVPLLFGTRGGWVVVLK